MQETAAFIVYLCLVLAVGIYFFVKGQKTSGGDKDYFLGGREMNGFVAALSAGASDMSAWVLMGLPGSVYLYGVGKVWIAVGLMIGTVLSWIFVAPRLRRMSIKANDAITVPQYLTQRFKTKNPALQIISAIIFIIAYCIYSASSIVACGNLFAQIFDGVVEGSNVKTYAMIGATIIIMIYTFLGGFNAVCWTDFFQGMLMLIALMAVPIIACVSMGSADFVPLAPVVTSDNYYSVWTGLPDVLSGLAWGLGYFGMPHIIVRFMAIKNEKEMKKSQIIGSFWTVVILTMAVVVALVGHQYLGSYLAEGDKSLIFVVMVRSLVPAVVSGILLSAILAASMSTADSQLLTSSSAFASDIYKPLIRKEASNKEMLWAGRVVVALIAIVALLIALNPNCGGIMELVECAWGAFGAAFGPVILLSLYWKRFTYKGCVAGVATGFIVDALWYAFLSGKTGIYEILPGFIFGLVAAVVVTLLDKEPSKEVQELFEAGIKKEEN